MSGFDIGHNIGKDTSQDIDEPAKINYPSIGILSGAGPYAGLVLHQKIIAACQRQNAIEDGDYPLISHISYPFLSTGPKGVVNIELATTELNQALSLLAHCDKILLACNSLLDCVPLDYRPRLVDPRAILKNRYAQSHDSMVVLASQTSIESSIYEGMAPHLIYPNSHQRNKSNNLTLQDLVDRLIVSVMSHQMTRAQKEYDELIQNVKTAYPQSLILLGCTELCVFPSDECINTLDMLVGAVIG